MAKLDARTGAAEGGERFGHPLRVVADEAGGGGNHVGGAPPVAAQRPRDGSREGADEALHARQRGSPEAGDALIVVTDHADVALPAGPLHQPLLGWIGSLVLVD